MVRVKDYHKIHLVRLEEISKRKEGEWGLKNTHIFGWALAIKSLWRALLGESIWQRIVLKKYLKKHSMVAWIKTL